MTLSIKQNFQKAIGWAVNNPKRFFLYSMLFLTISYLGSIIQGIYFPTKIDFSIKAPPMYSGSDKTQKSFEARETEMQKIVEELKLLKIKKDNNGLLQKDSVRIEYLYNQFQKLKNGHNKKN